MSLYCDSYMKEQTKAPVFQGKGIMGHSEHVAVPLSLIVPRA